MRHLSHGAGRGAHARGCVPVHRSASYRRSTENLHGPVQKNNVKSDFFHLDPIDQPTTWVHQCTQKTWFSVVSWSPTPLEKVRVACNIACRTPTPPGQILIQTFELCLVKWVKLFRWVSTESWSPSISWGPGWSKAMVKINDLILRSDF